LGAPSARAQAIHTAQDGLHVLLRDPVVTERFAGGDGSFTPPVTAAPTPLRPPLSKQPGLPDQPRPGLSRGGYQ
jgi:hypothetical protein